MKLNGHTKTALSVVVGLLLTLAGWAANTQVQRLDRVEEEQKRRAPTIAAMQEAVSNVKGDVAEIKSDIRKMRELLEQRK